LPGCFETETLLLKDTLTVRTSIVAPEGIRNNSVVYAKVSLYKEEVKGDFNSLQKNLHIYNIYAQDNLKTTEKSTCILTALCYNRKAPFFDGNQVDLQKQNIGISRLLKAFKKTFKKPEKRC